MIPANQIFKQITGAKVEITKWIASNSIWYFLDIKIIIILHRKYNQTNCGNELNLFYGKNGKLYTKMKWSNKMNQKLSNMIFTMYDIIVYRLQFQVPVIDKTKCSLHHHSWNESISFQYDIQFEVLSNSMSYWIEVEL